MIHNISGPICVLEHDSAK